MKIDAILQELRFGELVMRQLPAGCALGFPRLQLRSGMLTMCLMPYRVVNQAGTLHFFAPAACMELAYPFRRLERFQRFRGSGVVAVVDEDCFRASGAAYKSLLALCDQVLEAYETDSETLEETLRKYERYFEETTKQMGLNQIYAKFDLGNGEDL